MSQDRPRPKNLLEWLSRGTPTAAEIHQLARLERQGLRRCYVPAEMAAWERTIKREVSAAAQSLERWRQLRPGEPEGPKTATLVYDIAFLTALLLRQADRMNLITRICNRELRMTAEEFELWSVRTLRTYYMDSLAPHFSVSKKEYEGQKALEKALAQVPKELRPMAPLANAGDFQYVDGRLVFGDGPYRPVSDDQFVRMRKLLEEYGPRRGRPRVKNPKPATLRKRRQRERERESVPNSCVRNREGEEMLATATDEQLVHDAEQLTEMAREIFSIALRWQARFPHSRVLADTVERFIHEALAAS